MKPDTSALNYILGAKRTYDISCAVVRDREITYHFMRDFSFTAPSKNAKTIEYCNKPGPHGFLNYGCVTFVMNDDEVYDIWFLGGFNCDHERGSVAYSETMLATTFDFLRTAKREFVLSQIYISRCSGQKFGSESYVVLGGVGAITPVTILSAKISLTTSETFKISSKTFEISVSKSNRLISFFPERMLGMYDDRGILQMIIIPTFLKDETDCQNLSDLARVIGGRLNSPLRYFG